MEFVLLTLLGGVITRRQKIANLRRSDVLISTGMKLGNQFGS